MWRGIAVSVTANYVVIFQVEGVREAGLLNRDQRVVFEDEIVYDELHESFALDFPVRWFPGSTHRSGTIPIFSGCFRLPVIAKR